MNPYLATLVAEERMHKLRDEAATRRLLAHRRQGNPRHAGTNGSSILLAVSRRLVVMSNYLRRPGEQQYAVQACCTA